MLCKLLRGSELREVLSEFQVKLVTETKSQHIL